eukprot:scaffold46826_cov66-Cyclotella_meneghiniana.AAC.3
MRKLQNTPEAEPIPLDVKALTRCPKFRLLHLRVLNNLLAGFCYWSAGHDMAWQGKAERFDYIAASYINRDKLNLSFQVLF